MKVKFKTPRAQLYFGTASVILGFALPSTHAIAPPPPSGPPAALVIGLEITGPSSVLESASAEYICIASYSDGTSKSVAAAWSENSGSASISTSGVLSAGDVSGDEEVTVDASYSGISASSAVTIIDVPVILTGLEVSGPATVAEESSAQYTCIASYSNGAKIEVTPVWSDNSVSAEISTDGVLLAGDVAANVTVTLTASFGGLTDSHEVAIGYVPPVLLSLMILGPDSLVEETSSSYMCMASYSDGAYIVVSPAWTMSSGIASVNASGLVSAGDVSANGAAVLRATMGGLSVTKSVSIAYVAPGLMGLAISGPAVVDEESLTQFVCTAAYSDGTQIEISPEWSVDSLLALIDAEGQLQAGDIDVDVDMVLSASYNGLESELPVTVRVAATQVIYPLNEFAGKTLRADLWDSVNQQLLSLGEFDSPDQLIIEDLNPNQWYWITIKELSGTSGEWMPVQENWINM